MTLPALTVSVSETRPAPLDMELARIRTEYAERERADLQRCKRLHALWPRWQRERNTSVRDFLRTVFPRFEEREATAYAHLYAGAAQNATLPGAHIAQLEPFGWALVTGGKAPADVFALIETLGEDAARSALRRERSRKAAEGTTTRRLPESAADALDILAHRLIGHPDAPTADTERRGMVVQMLEVVAHTPALFDALATTASTGEHTTEALTTALSAQRVDPYEVMKAGGCLWPGCHTKTGLHLHHVPLDEDTKRGNEIVIPLCPYHHNQDGGHDHAHALTRWALYDLFGGEALFWKALSLRQAEALHAVHTGNRAANRERT